jgi:hypothetical protein
VAYKRQKLYGGKTYSVNKTTHTNGRQRVTHTSKPTKNLTISKSVNRNGSVRQTTTYRDSSGYTHRSTKTFGTSPKKYRAPKQSSYKAPKTYSTRRSRRQQEADLRFIGSIISFFFKTIWWAIKYTGKSIAFVYNVFYETTNSEGWKRHAWSIAKTFGFFWALALLTFLIYNIL